MSNFVDTDARSYKDNDLDSDGDGVVDAADDADTVDGKHAGDLGATFYSTEISLSAGSSSNLYVGSSPGAVVSPDPQSGDAVYYNSGSHLWVVRTYQGGAGGSGYVVQNDASGSRIFAMSGVEE